MGIISLVKKNDFERIPTQWEQDVAEIYVNERQIIRPDTNIKKVLITILLFILATSVVIWFVYYVFTTFSIFEYSSSKLRNFLNMHPVFSILIISSIVFLIELFFCFKYAVIGAIKLYQRYAPEEIRRRCLFMPTCSEYTIMAVSKYGAVIGLFKSYNRLVYRCRGNIYQIDYP